jgi:enoyl-CoA hydratase/carnithine racemase
MTVVTKAPVRRILAGGRRELLRGDGPEAASAGGARKGSLEAVLDQRLRVLDAIENLGKPVVAAPVNWRRS